MRKTALVCLGLTALSAVTHAPARDPCVRRRSLSQGRFEEAERGYARALANKPDDPAALAGARAGAALPTTRSTKRSRWPTRRWRSRPTIRSRHRILRDAQDRKTAFGPERYRFTLDHPVAIKFDRTDPLPILTATIGTREVKFLLDTGGPNIIISPQLAEELGLTVTEAGLAPSPEGARPRSSGPWYRS